jgi:drug/metabolite transporter (DMT)-like permease
MRATNGNSASRRELQRASAIAFGIGLISLVFLLETAVAHRRVPSAASPWVWTALALVAVLAFGRGWWLRARAQSAPD